MIFQDGNPIYWNEIAYHSRIPRVKTSRLDRKGNVRFSSEDEDRYYAVAVDPYSSHETVDNGSEFIPFYAQGAKIDEPPVAKIFNYRTFGYTADPIWDATKCGRFLADADMVLGLPIKGRWLTQGEEEVGRESLISAWFGKVEVIMSLEGHIKEIFNWADDSERIKREQVVQSNKKPFLEWLDDVSTRLIPAGTDTDYMQDSLLLGLKEVAHMTRDKAQIMCFTMDLECSEHKKKASQHVGAKDCSTMIAAALHTIDRMWCTTVFLAAYNGKVNCGIAAHPKFEPCDKGHMWKLNDVIEVEYGKVKFDIPYEDVCEKCGSIRYVTGVPKWLRLLIQQAGYTLPIFTHGQIIDQLVREFDESSEKSGVGWE
jgi:hypothetical protein